jgi:hypothetical protein
MHDAADKRHCPFLAVPSSVPSRYSAAPSACPDLVVGVICPARATHIYGLVPSATSTVAISTLSRVDHVILIVIVMVSTFCEGLISVASLACSIYQGH